MAIIALASAKGSPGVTTTCLALTLSWARPVLLVEADPAGGDIMAGYVRAQLPTDRGLGYLAVSARHGRVAEEFNDQLIDLAQPKSQVSRVLLAGVTDPAHTASIGPVWPHLADYFVRLGRDGLGSDVIVDCGRLAAEHVPLPLIRVADVVLLVVRTTLRSASTAAPAVDLLRRELALGDGPPDRLGLLAIEGGEYRSADLAYGLRVPVVVSVPWRPTEAAALSDGIGRASSASPLLRAARSCGEVIRKRVMARVTSIDATAASRPARSDGPMNAPAGSPERGMVRR